MGEREQASETCSFNTSTINSTINADLKKHIFTALDLVPVKFDWRENIRIFINPKRKCWNLIQKLFQCSWALSLRVFALYISLWIYFFLFRLAFSLKIKIYIRNEILNRWFDSEYDWNVQFVGSKHVWEQNTSWKQCTWAGERKSIEGKKRWTHLIQWFAPFLVDSENSSWQASVEKRIYLFSLWRVKLLIWTCRCLSSVGEASRSPSPLTRAMIALAQTHPHKHTDSIIVTKFRSECAVLFKFLRFLTRLCSLRYCCWRFILSVNGRNFWEPTHHNAWIAD